MFNRLRLGNLYILDPLPLFPSSYIPIFTDASGVHVQNNPNMRGGVVYLPDQSLERVVLPGNRKWTENHGHSTTLLESLACLQGYLAALKVYGRNTFVILIDNTGECYSFRKGHSHCLFVLTVLKDIDDVLVGGQCLELPSEKPEGVFGLVNW